ncbi:isocitrate lyase [Tenacibaculum maritimum]|uniref:isocitrate lyase n=1 Tax=Tenacibaculum maritimum TaxID=107401 RepID=UPI001E449EAB|nr:isocitrate lyase [Tenacibaculum maritimum]MCD9584757.1 isocitrate lyase [Tenacibaculum maritimum]MCD9621629.1 isocitrate lyase [Tenacibaculum maritimum]MCD9626804.1 isocitrate lyase [Tenacibaculum maritimum]MCD9630498.1 isocitrate lyase [Tenacibaculum maritimum]MCD9633766.1 isocitrate lyase [Tenacibaculum maritimum]
MKNLAQGSYNSALEIVKSLKKKYGDTWNAITPENAAKMIVQNRFKTGLDIAKYTAAIMREDMAAYDADASKYTQSLGCWHGFVAQQKMIAIKKHHKTTSKRYLYLSGWMVAALRSEFGPLPDQSMHEKTAVPALIKEIYDFLRQADAIALNDLFRRLEKGEDVQEQIDNFETHIVPIIADIDAGFGNEEATYLLAKKMIEAGACAIQIENQVSDAKQCGHQDGKVTVPHEDFIAKLNAIRYAFLELGIEEGIIVARTDSEGAGLTQKLPVSQESGDLASRYLAFVETEELSVEEANEGDVLLKREGKLVRPMRLANGLYKFKEGSNIDRVVLDCITSLKNGADLLWIETPTPHVGQIAHMVNRVREVIPNAKLVYNNSPSFNWTLNFRNQVYEAMEAEGKDVSMYDKNNLMDARYDGSELCKLADEKIRTFQEDGAREAGIFHHLITLPTYHTTALHMNDLTEGYFGKEGMLAYVRGVQRQEIRKGVSCVKHQRMAGSNLGDDHKVFFAGDKALKAGGEKNTSNQFETGKQEVKKVLV